MSKLAYHVAHYKAGQVGAIGRHNFEKRGAFDQHSNQDIDQGRSWLNVQLVDQGRSLAAEIKNDLEDRCTGRITSASNVMTETITYPPESLQADRDRVIAYFTDVLDWHQSHFGAENVKSAVIHFDETTPHMHTDLIPLTADGRLSSKEVFARAALHRQHTDLAKHLQDRGWDIERGESTADKQVRSLSVAEYKKQAEKEKERVLGEVHRVNQDRQNAIQELQKSLDVQKAMDDRYEHLKSDIAEMEDRQRALSKVELEQIRPERGVLGGLKGVSEKEFRQTLNTAKKVEEVEKNLEVWKERCQKAEWELITSADKYEKQDQELRKAIREKEALSQMCSQYLEENNRLRRVVRYLTQKMKKHLPERASKYIERIENMLRSNNEWAKNDKEEVSK